MSRRVLVLVPAHSEEACIAGILRSLNRQTRPPDRIVVVADNCTDNTAGIAAEYGAEVLATVDNQYKKAGRSTRLSISFCRRSIRPTACW